MIAYTERLQPLLSNLSIFDGLQRGIEKEGLRVGTNGYIAASDHPAALGSTLTNPYITTDYAEALLELITRPHSSVTTLLQELSDIHQFTASHLGQEVLWNQSMPAHLPAEKDIRIAWYGNSNAGMQKHVYRRGLAERYGKRMQCIAGIHYNFSLPDRVWSLLGYQGDSQAQRTEGYLALIRNFTRYSWLLMYLFGASPVVSADFLGGHSLALEKLHDDSYYLPWATSLRMSDLGYQNKEAQAELQLCYNDLDTFLLRMRHAATTPWPAYADIGTHRDGEWIQLNSNILQIENEYYSNIRPKRTTLANERPATALARRGVEYVEVRCLDIDPYSPLGISEHTCRFLDSFLLFCATEDSAFFPENGFCLDSKTNFATVVKEGRKPGLHLKLPAKQAIPLHDWALDILNRMHAQACLLDEYEGTTAHQAALTEQVDKVMHPERTPSARLLSDIKNSGQSFHQYTYQHSQRTTQQLAAVSMSPELTAHYEHSAAESWKAHAEIEAQQTESFDEFMTHYNQMLLEPDNNTK